MIVHGADAGAIYANAAFALADLICDADAVAPREERAVQATGADLAETVVRLMNALLYLVDADRLVLPHLEVAEATPTSVRGVARGEPLDTARHGFKGALKAATYHDLAVWQAEGGLRVRVVLDV